MSNSNFIDTSVFSFREKLSYISNSETNKGVIKKFGAICRLIVSYGTCDLHITEKDCSDIVKLNDKCIFSRKVSVLNKWPKATELDVPKATELDVEVKRLRQEKIKLEKNCQQAIDDKKNVEKYVVSLKKQNNEYMDRLSTVFTTQMAGNNDIANMGDPNRSMKLAEQFQCLYTEEYSEYYASEFKKAMLNIDPGTKKYAEVASPNEKKILKLFFNIMIDSYDEASKHCNNQRDVAFNLIGVKLDRALQCSMFNKHADVNIKQITEAVKLKYKNQDGVNEVDSNCSKYIEKCVKLAYYMAADDSLLKLVVANTDEPVLMSGKDKLFTSLCLDHSPRGKTKNVDYTVWPALATTNDVVLAKGAVVFQ